MQALPQAFLATVLFVIPLWKVCKRAGFHPALSLVAVVPLLGILIVGAVLAFAEWPATRRRNSVTEA
jgi:hypothetical protein